MHPKPITARFQGSQLIAVPAIHFSHVFSDEVNRVCRSLRMGPDAVAVELGPLTAQAAANWLKELGENRKGNKVLPIMLGLIKPNRIIRASLKQRTFELQRETGKDLSELPPEILHRELGYAGHGLLCITPTDSIIEAIRCSLELEIPVYGVDLEEMADGDRAFVTLQDPIRADGNVAGYVAQNAAYAGGQYDEEVDTRREIAMAARLKALLKVYRRVLFTCGMGHWVRVLTYLKDPSIQPAILGESDETTNGNFKRVVVHPQIAIDYMGLFPALVSEYQKARRPANEPGSRLDSTIKLNPSMIFENLMQEAYREYFCAGRNSQDLGSLAGFEAYLADLNVLNLRFVPDIFSITKAAREMMSKAFQKALIKKFIDFPWTLPQEQPDCSFLAPIAGSGTDSTCRLSGQSGSVHREHFYIRSIPENRKCTHNEIYFEWKEADENGKIPPMGNGIVHTWAPWTYLISAMCLRGVSMTKKWEHEKSVEVFAGSFLDGIAIKEVIHAYARGEDRLYVYDTVKKKRFSNASFTGAGFPVVFLLEPEENRGSHWAPLYIDFSWVEKHVRDREHFEHVKKERGNKMISLIGYGDHGVETRISKENHFVQTDRYYGITTYQPDCWEMEQFAKWMEMTDYKRNPFCRNNMLDENYPSDLRASLGREHGIQIGEFDWSTTLILLAIPFAKDTVTVIAPNNYQVNPVIFKKAQSHGVEVRRLSLGCFSHQEIEKMSLNYMAPAINRDLEPKALFHRSVEEAIGELQTDNRHLVPRSCLNFGKY